jgi:ribosome-associated protein
MLDKKATDVVVLNVAKLTSVADYLVLGSAESDRQTRAIAHHVDGMLSTSGSAPLSIEGTASSPWVLIDFGDVVAHIFRHDVRQHYALERLWADAKRVRVPDELVSRPVTTTRARPVRKTRATKQV